MMMYYYLGAGYVAIAILGFIFSGLFGVSHNEKSESVALGAAFWPLVGFGFLGDLADNLRIRIGQKVVERANRPRPKKMKVRALERDEDEFHDAASCYREMDCKLCGHTLALKKSAS